MNSTDITKGMHIVLDIESKYDLQVRTVSHVSRGRVWVDDEQDGGWFEQDGVWVETTLGEAFQFSKNDDIELAKECGYCGEPSVGIICNECSIPHEDENRCPVCKREYPDKVGDLAEYAKTCEYCREVYQAEMSYLERHGL